MDKFSRHYNIAWVCIFLVLLGTAVICSKLESPILCYFFGGLILVGMVMYVVGIQKEYDKPKEIREKSTQKKNPVFGGHRGLNSGQATLPDNPPAYGVPTNRWPPSPNSDQEDEPLS